MLSKVACSVYTRKHTIAVQIPIGKCNKCILTYRTTEEPSIMLKKLLQPGKLIRLLSAPFAYFSCAYRFCNRLLRGQAVKIARY